MFESTNEDARVNVRDGTVYVQLDQDPLSTEDRKVFKYKTRNGSQGYKKISKFLSNVILLYIVFSSFINPCLVPFRAQKDFRFCHLRVCQFHRHGC